MGSRPDGRDHALKKECSNASSLHTHKERVDSRTTTRFHIHRFYVLHTREEEKEKEVHELQCINAAC